MFDIAMMKNYRASIAGIEAWLAASGLSASYVSILATENARAIKRIRAGTASMPTLVRLLEWMDAHPPKTVSRYASRTAKKA